MTPINYYDTSSKGKPPSRDVPLLIGVIVANAAFAATVVFWWNVMELLVSEPMKWATWEGMTSRPGLFEYPYILLWALPTGGIFAAWAFRRLHQPGLACCAAMFPIVLLGLVFGWFYLAPEGWH